MGNRETSPLLIGQHNSEKWPMPKVHVIREGKSSDLFITKKMHVYFDQ